MLGPFATASRRHIAIHQVLLLSHASYSYSAGGVRCPRQRRRRQRQRVTEGTAKRPHGMGPTNGQRILQGTMSKIYHNTPTACVSGQWPMRTLLGGRRAGKSRGSKNEPRSDTWSLGRTHLSLHAAQST